MRNYVPAVVPLGSKQSIWDQIKAYYLDNKDAVDTIATMVGHAAGAFFIPEPNGENLVNKATFLSY
jgi:hypothetical protein